MDIRASATRWWRLATSATVAGAPAWRWVAGAASLLVLALGLYRQLRPQYFNTADSDFYTYYQAALAVRGGANPFAPVVAWIHSYHPGDPLISNYYVYAPAFALLIVPLTVLPFAAANVVWGLLNLAFLAGGIYCFVRFAGERVSALTLLLLTTAASLLGVVRLEFNWGQADILLFFLVCASLWAKQERRPILAGILLAVACVTKPPMLLFVVFLLWKREYRFAPTAAGGFVVLLLAPFLLLGGAALSDQFTIWNFWSNQYVSFIDNESVRGALARLFEINPYLSPIAVAPALVTVVWLLFVAVVAVLVATRTRPQPLTRDNATVLEVGVIITAILLVSPLTEYVYTTLLLLPLLALFILVRRQGLATSAARWVAVGLAVIWLVLCLPLQQIEFTFATRMNAGGLASIVFVLLALPYVYVIVATLALQLYAGHLLGARPLPLRELPGALVDSARDWATSVRGMFGGGQAGARTTSDRPESLDVAQAAHTLESQGASNHAHSLDKRG